MISLYVVLLFFTSKSDDDTKLSGMVTEGPGQAQEVGLCIPHEVQQDKDPTSGLGQTQTLIQAGQRMD